LILTFDFDLASNFDPTARTTVKERRFSASISARKSDHVERTLLSAAFDFDLDL